MFSKIVNLHHSIDNVLEIATLFNEDKNDSVKAFMGLELELSVRRVIIELELDQIAPTLDVYYFVFSPCSRSKSGTNCACCKYEGWASCLMLPRVNSILGCLHYIVWAFLGDT